MQKKSTELFSIAKSIELSCNSKATENVSNPLVSVVVATKGNERSGELDRCLKSLQQQTFREFEIVLVYSTFPEGLNEYVENCNCNFRVLKETGKTLGAARNLGVKNSKGEFVVFIDDDAQAPEDWLFKIYSTFQKFPMLACLGGSYLTPPKEFEESPLKFVVGSFTDSRRGESVSEDRSAVGKIAGCNVAYKKEVFEKVGYINEKYRSGEDWEFHMRLVENGYHLRFDPTMSVWHNRGGLKHTFWNSTRMVPFFLSWKTIKFARHESFFASFYLTNIAFLVLLITLIIDPLIFAILLILLLMGFFIITAVRTMAFSWKILYYPLIILYTFARLAGFYYGVINTAKLGLSQRISSKDER